MHRTRQSKSVKKKPVKTLKRTPAKQNDATKTPQKDALLTEINSEPLVAAEAVHKHTGLERRAVYSMARAGLIPSYRTGAKAGGVRFRISEVLTAIRRPAKVEPTTPTSEAVTG